MNSLILRIYISENDSCKGMAAHEKIIELMRDKKIAGATVLHGMEGYGTHSKIHTSNILRFESELPIIIEAIDREKKIRDIAVDIKQMMPSSLITVQQIEIIEGQ